MQGKNWLVALGISAALGTSGCIIISSNDCGRPASFSQQNTRMYECSPAICNQATRQVLTGLGVHDDDFRADQLGGKFDFSTANGMSGTVTVDTKNNRSRVSISTKSGSQQVARTILDSIDRQVKSDMLAQANGSAKPMVINATAQKSNSPQVVSEAGVQQVGLVDTQPANNHLGEPSLSPLPMAQLPPKSVKR